MSKEQISRETMIEELRVDMRPASRPEALQRIRSRALGSRSTRQSRWMSRTKWRMATGIAVAAAVVAVATFALAPGQQTAAFAREKAAAALLFQAPGKILHAEMVFTQVERGFPEGENNSTDERWSLWADGDNKRMRNQFVNTDDGSLNELTVRVADRGLTYLRYAKKLIATDNPPGLPLNTVMDDTAGSMRQMIANGTAEVTGTRVIDGEEYWAVMYSLDTGDGGTSVETITMRKSDYLPKTWERKTTQEINGYTGVITKSVRFDLVEQLEPSSLPNGFFSLDAVRNAAKTKAPVEKQ